MNKKKISELDEVTDLKNKDLFLLSQYIIEDEESSSSSSEDSQYDYRFFQSKQINFINLKNSVLSNVNNIQFDTTAEVVVVEGQLAWNDADGTLDLGMSGGDVTLQIGQEMFTKVHNQTGATIPNGSVVYFSGRSGFRPLISLAKADAHSTSCVAGVATQDISSPSDGFITTMGYVRGIKTNYTGTGIWGTTWEEGDRLYVSKTDAGVLTNIEPAVPHHSDIVGTVGIIHGNVGSILITIQKHQSLEEMADVDGTPLTASGQLLVWDNEKGYFDFDKNINDYVKPTLSTKTSNYQIVSSDFTILVNAINNAITITLPEVSVSGKVYNIKCIDDTNLVDIDPNGNNIDGDSNNFQLIKHETVTIQSDGTNWWII